ncbi:hypothetical protein [Dactylosporangium sp. NPDC051484]|uniref:hypothetical protein n=1 Tax=Dactylosporangium sp. NPDC051484 TaxID=3154942 RepID=UPI00344B8397
MTTPRDFFTFELEWEQRGSLFVLRNDDRSAQSRAFARAAEERLFRSRGVVSAEVVLAPELPVWTLLHLNPDPYGSMWCFVEQGRGGPFGSDGGCRVSFAKLGRHHPAEVWRAGRDLAWIAAQRTEPELAPARNVLAAIAVERNRIALPPAAGSNAALVEAVLSVLPARVAAGWVWSTHLFGVADRFVAGRLDDDDRRPAPEVPPQYVPALDWLAERLGRVDDDTWRLVRNSRADQLTEFLDALPVPAAQEPEDRRPRPAPARVHAVAQVAEPPLPAAPLEEPEPAPLITPGRSSVRGGDLSMDETVRLPVAALQAGMRAAGQPLRWVQWADMGRGFRAQGEESAQAPLRRYWTAAEQLLDAEKVPNGVDNTLKYPLWTLRRVNVEGIGQQWCFIERGRGNLVGADGQLQKDRQFGMAGGIRFGFASFLLAPIEVWRSGTGDAWTPVSRPRKGWAASNRGIVRRLFAALGSGQTRVHLPGNPAENWLVIEQALAVLPRRLAARWVWSTCLFQVRDAYVAGSVPSDLHDSEPIERLAAQVAAKKLPESEQRFLETLTTKQAEAFDFLVDQAERAVEKSKWRNDFADLLRRTEAEDLREFLFEMADRLNLSPMRMEDVPAALMTREGQASLHSSGADLVAQYAEAAPKEARRYLSSDPMSPVAPDLTEGLRSRQVTEPAENQFDIPTAKRPATQWTQRSSELLRHHTEESERAELITTVIQPGGVLHDLGDLQAAEQFVTDLGLTQDRYPQFYPAQLIREIVGHEAPSKEVERGVRLSPDPERLLYSVVTRLQHPTVTKAAWIMVVLDEVMTDVGSTTNMRERIAARLLSSQPKKEQGTYWAAVVRVYGLGHITDAQRTRVFDAGTAVLYERNHRKPLENTELYGLKQTVGSHVSVPIVPEEEHVGAMDVMRGSFDRMRQRQRAKPYGWAPWGVLAGLGVVATVTVALYVTQSAPQQAPVGTTTTPPSITSQAPPSPTPMDSPSSQAPVEPPKHRKLAPIDAPWETKSNTDEAVRMIREDIIKQVGPGNVRIISFVLDCSSAKKSSATDAVTRVKAGLEQALAAQLQDVQIEGRPHWTGKDGDLMEVGQPGCTAHVEVIEAPTG